MKAELLNVQDPFCLLVYAAAFVAVCVPVALWRRDGGLVETGVPPGDWTRLPAIFRLLWRPVRTLETTLGASLAYVLKGRARRYAELAEVAALPLAPRQVFVCKALCAPALGLVGALAFLAPGVPADVARAAVAVLAVVGWLLPSLALGAAAQTRQEEVVRALPFAIDLMGSAMRAGLDFGAAMRYYTGLGGGGALEAEFTRVLRDASLGKPLAESLQDMAGRMRVKTFTAFAGVVAYGAEVGASIAETLKVHGEEMRRERFALAEQKAARAPSVMIFPLAVFILPAVFLVIFVPVILQFLSTQAQ